jgi:hypothetical protein
MPRVFPLPRVMHHCYGYHDAREGAGTQPASANTRRPCTRSPISVLGEHFERFAFWYDSMRRLIYARTLTKIRRNVPKTWVTTSCRTGCRQVAKGSFSSRFANGARRTSPRGHPFLSVRCDLRRQLVGITHRPPRSIAESLAAMLPVELIVPPQRSPTQLFAR